MIVDDHEELSSEKALQLARQGKVAWNDWADKNPGVAVDFSGCDFTCEEISFADYIFPGSADFSNAKFYKADFRSTQFRGGYVNFNGALFYGEEIYFMKTVFSGGDADFYGAKFTEGITIFFETVFSGGNANFEGATFNKEVFFIDTKFEHESNFSGATFIKFLNLEGCTFRIVPDFRRSIISTHFTFHKTEIDYSKNKEKKYRLFNKANGANDADKFRRLKELAVQARDHEREQDFFAKELKAKRFYETTGLALAWSYLYEWTSNFGLSTSRPIYWLLATWFCFGAVYGVMSTSFSTHPFEALGKSLILSGALLTPFVAISRTAISDMRESLYGDGVSLWWLDVAAIFQGILGLIFIFLIGLALRNRFRI